MTDQSITLDLSLINGVLQYLGTRPYGEVYQLVQAIQAQAAPQVTPVEEPQPEEQAA